MHLLEQIVNLINGIKRELINLYWGGKEVPEVQIEIDGHNSSSKRELNYLGVMFDHKYQMKADVKYIAKKASGLIGELSKLMLQINDPSSA